ncbi:iron-containing alcohol dehydrogenase [Sporolactobacillus spathodeae]|uniref:Alcohol dehydrogenase YqhD (Iron-dependent ADH family) n=1 Tax=Sporolactobacillus spathodeae TaxID=1465502 RepID=A0ABS2Q8G0_9BACL|nr:iron-containing alcohol dehydrogenase [Sporolactobacillus spathodeae]MBM7658071.1 alcohol dehydrogenase YqhD (iron-dependent ADH family) [Sporolactobacillus spathodeae]
MDDFIFHNPTKLIFGKGQLAQLKKEVPKYGRRVLLVYGGGSIKRSGLYDQVRSILDDLHAEVYELSGVEPNPRLTTVKRGIDICATEDIQFLLAVGGGSVIDATKAIAVGACFDGDPWDFITRKGTPVDALPFGTVLTLAATGSEMNPNSVITNWDTHEKYGWSSAYSYPSFSILDPTFTETVPKNQTIYGMVDMMAHVFEHYFHRAPHTPLQDRLCESILQTVIETAPKMVADLENYQLRETILYCGTMALNGMVSMGFSGDWGSHNIEHAISAVYDIPHGGGLAIIFPNWMKHTLDENVGRYKQLAERVFHIDASGKSDREVAEAGIDALRAFWTHIGAPSTLADYGIDESKLDLIADRAMARGEFGGFKKLNKADVLAILQASR